MLNESFDAIKKTKFLNHSKNIPLNFKEEIHIDKLPYNTQLSISFYQYHGIEQEKCLCSCTLDLFDDKFQFQTGDFLLILWPFIRPNP